MCMDDHSQPATTTIEEFAMRPHVFGVGLDRNTRCAHYRSALDIIAIKVCCCGKFYACKDCHDALANHPLIPWAREQFGERAVLCGECGTVLTIGEYLACESRCPKCHAGFNPRCNVHHNFYFSRDGKRETPHRRNDAG
jgi:uncharacterized CHY-type Zn-finger protein